VNQPAPEQKVLGFFTLVALCAGNMIGAGVFLLPSSLAKFGNMGLVAWVLTGFGAIALALVFANLSLRINKSGGPYAYCQEAFGDFVGFEIAYNYWMGSWIGNTALCISFTGYFSFFVPTLAHNNSLRFFIEAGMVWFFTFINILGLRSAAIVQLITFILKLFPIVLLTLIGLFLINPHHFTTLNIPQSNNFESISAAAILTLWSFLGLESATVPSESAVSPKTVSRATIVGVALVGVLYLLSTIAVVGVIPYQQLQYSSSPYAQAAAIIFGHFAATFHVSTHFAELAGGGLIALGAMFAAAGCLNGWILLQSIVPLAAARDGLFPKVFAKTDKNGTPVFGLLISAVAMTLLLSLTLQQDLIKQFTFIILLATLAQLIPYFFTACAELYFLCNQPEKFSRNNLIKYLILTILATLYSLWAIAGAGQDVMSYGLLLFLSGVPIYAWIR
jgi:APA family basic amino acid/polyamine antiporter